VFRRSLLSALALTATFAVPARADVLLVPYLGQSFSGVVNAANAGYPTTYGVRLEWFARGVIGVGLDVARTPDFLGDAQGLVRTSTISTVMANLIIGGPIPEERGFRPYLTGGMGALMYDLTSPSGVEASQTDIGYNVGLGATVLFSRHVGAEIDFRYFRNNEDFTLGGLDFKEKILEYARWTGGLVLRF